MAPSSCFHHVGWQQRSKSTSHASTLHKQTYRWCTVWNTSTGSGTYATPVSTPLATFAFEALCLTESRPISAVLELHAVNLLHLQVVFTSSGITLGYSSIRMKE